MEEMKYSDEIYIKMYIKIVLLFVTGKNDIQPVKKYSKKVKFIYGDRILTYPRTKRYNSQFAFEKKILVSCVHIFTATTCAL